MKVFKNKYFILGNLVLILIAIPLTLLFVKRQQDIRSKAAPTTRITFTPEIVSFQGESCSEQIVTAKIDPGENIVSTVELFLTYDATKFDITIEPNNTAFPQTLRGPTISNGQASVTLNIGGSVTNAIQTITDLATITIVPIATTDGTAAILQVDSSKTRVLSLSESDEATENVFLSGGQVAVTIDATCTGGGTEETTSPTPTPVGEGVGGPSPTSTPSATPSVTAGANQAPVCATLTASPSASGSAPFALTLSAQGTDSDGTISKATFNFGDGTVQDVTEGVGTAAVTVELSHTYQSAGTFTSSVLFTDNSGGVSSSCVKQITVSSSGDTTPTPTTGGIQPTSTPTPTPTIESPGSISSTVAIIGGLIFAIIGGLILIAL